MLMDRRKISEIVVFASLYAVLTWVFHPISYHVFQFRVSECLKSIVVRRKWLIWAFVVGNALSNIPSPFAGLWEWVWMPFMNLVGGTCAYVVGSRLKGIKGFVVGGIVFALWIAFGVAFMLSQLFGIPFPVIFVYILVPELILIGGISPIIMARVDKLLR